MWRSHLVVVAVALVCLACRARADDGETCSWSGPRVDCGYVGITKDVCEGKGCCWSPVDFKGAPHVDLPWCFHPNTGASEYTVTEVEEQGDGLQATLRLSKTAQKELGPDIKTLKLDVEEVSDSILRIKMTDANSKRWEVPGWLFKPDLSSAKHANAKDKKQYKLKYSKDPFSFTVSRAGGDVDGQLAQQAGHSNKEESDVIFDTKGLRLVYKDQYLELSTRVDRKTHLFGAGERASETLHLRRNGLPRALWNHDLGPTFLEQNMYSSHPFVLALAEDGSAWGALLFSSNAMDIVPTPDQLSWRVTGGVLDLWLFTGPTPLAVMDQYTAVIGRPAMMPYWSLGWHQCKYGYRSVWEVEAVVANYSDAKLPLECIWTDIDHMDGWRDFTFDPVNFPLQEMQRFVSDLHGKGQKWVPIVDPGIKVDHGYAPYDQGIEEDIFVKGVDGKPYLGQVWPGPCHFPDFLYPKGQAFFKRQLQNHYGMVPWDGIWIDMDEISNFCTGDICHLRSSPAPGSPAARDEQHALSRPSSSGRRLHSAAGASSGTDLRDDPPWVCHLDCHPATGLNDSQAALLNPPYKISNYLTGAPLGDKAMSVLAYHYDGTLEYDAHNLYGLSECKTTAEAVEEARGKRPFVLSRSSFTGVGSYAAHWTGDNAATWTDLGWSIPGVLNIGLFGIPMAGADICGFHGDTTEELCARWVELGAFYPFSRDHSGIGTAPQELYRWPMVTEAGRKVLGMRYSLLNYLYTTFRQAHKAGAPVMRPLWMNFPSDPQTHEIDRQFMVGDALLVTPVLQAGADSVTGYLPPGTWHSLWSKGDSMDAKEGRQQKFPAPIGEIPLYMLGGKALVMQEPALTTAEVARSPLTVVVALPEVLSPESEAAAQLGAGASAVLRASGEVYWDDGESVQVGSSLCHFLSINTTVSRLTEGAGYLAQTLLLFGSQDMHHRHVGAVGTHSRSVCAPASDASAAASAASMGFEWPEVASVEVLGWKLPVDSDSLTMEVVQRTDTCGGLMALRTLALPSDALSATNGLLRIDLSALNHRLECPYGLRLSWASAAGAQLSAS